MGIFYENGKPSEFSHHLISHITGNSNFSKDADFSAEYDEFFIEKVNGYVTVMHRNVRLILDEIAKSVGFEFESEKDPNKFNEDLVSFINAQKIRKITQCQRMRLLTMSLYRCRLGLVVPFI
ncbi:MAG: hypothetical protein ACLR5N_00750 [Haemophilus parainfluenzae]